MKILIDVHGLRGQKTGKAFYTHNLLHGLSLIPEAKKHHFFLFSPAKFNLGFKKPENFFWQVGYPSGIRFHLALLKELERKKYDLFFSPTSFIPLAFGQGKMVGVIYDFIAFSKDNFQKDKKAEILEKLLINRVVKNSQALMAISQHTQKELLSRFPEAKGKSFVVLGSAKKYPKRTPAQKVLSKYRLKGAKYLLFVGTLESRKNLPNTLKAFRLFLDRLKPARRPAPKFVLAGKQGWGFRKISTAIKKLQLTRQIKLLGYVPDQDLPALYQSAQFLVYIPFDEGFGLPVAEAISFGKACLASRTSSLPEVVGQCGLQVDPNDPQKISEAMFRLWADTQLRKKCERKTHAWSKNFSIQKNARKLLRMFEATFTTPL